MSSCDICVEDYNGSRIEVACTCGYSCCRKCLRTYLSEQTGLPHCPSCGIEYSRATAVEHLGKSWFNGEYRKIRKRHVLLRERAMLPEAAIHVPVLAARRRADETLAAARDAYAYARQAKYEAAGAVRAAETAKRIAYSTDSSTVSTVIGEDKVLRPCSADNCEGFVSTQWKCGTCSKWTCRHCREIIGSDKNAPHECCPDTLATVEAIKAATKPCPGCKTPTERVSGCYQMYCTKCGCWWNYNTGKKDNSTFRHNPHYTALLATGALAPEAGGCALGVLDREQTRALTRACQNMWRLSIQSRLQARPAIQTHDDMAEALAPLSVDTAIQAAAFFDGSRGSDSWNTPYKGVLRVANNWRPGRLYRLLSIPGHLNHAIERLQAAMPDHPTSQARALDRRAKFILGEYDEAKLTAAAFKDQTDAEIAVAQHDILVAARDALGNALLELHSQVTKWPLTWQASMTSAGAARSMWRAVLKAHHDTLLIFAYVNTETNKIKQDYSRATWCFFDMDDPVLQFAKSPAMVPPDPP